MSHLEPRDIHLTLRTSRNVLVSPRAILSESFPPPPTFLAPEGPFLQKGISWLGSKQDHISNVNGKATNMGPGL